MNYKDLYETYTKKFNDLTNYAKKYGEELYDSQKLTKEEFKTIFKQKKEQIESVLHRKVSNNDVVKELIDQHKYSGTLAQGKALREAMKKQGVVITWQEARKWGGVNPEDIKHEKIQSFWEDIKMERKAYMLRNPFATNAEVSRYIAMTFFGS